MRSLALALIRLYQLLMPPAFRGGCRHRPTCSEYFLQAVEHCGFFKGSWMGICRIARCNPWGGSGYDPVPGTEKPPQDICGSHH